MSFPIVLAGEIFVTVRTDMRSFIGMRQHMRTKLAHSQCDIRFITIACEPLTTAGKIADEFLGILGFSWPVIFDEFEDVAVGHVVTSRGVTFAMATSRGRPTGG